MLAALAAYYIILRSFYLGYILEKSTKNRKKKGKKGEKRGEKRKKGKKGEKREKRREFFVELHVPEYKQARGARRAEGAARSEKFM